MKNRVRIVIWIVCLFIIAVIAIRGFRIALAPVEPVDPVEPDTPPTPVFSEEPVTMTAYLDIVADQPVRAFIGDKDITDPGTIFEIKPGVRTIVLKDYEGNELQSDIVVISGDRDELRQRIVLKAELISITFITNLDDCELYIDGEFDCFFNQEIGIILPTGVYAFEIRKEGYESFMQDITLDKDTPWEVEATLLPQE